MIKMFRNYLLMLGFKA